MRFRIASFEVACLRIVPLPAESRRGSRGVLKRCLPYLPLSSLISRLLFFCLLQNRSTRYRPLFEWRPVLICIGPSVFLTCHAVGSVLPFQTAHLQYRLYERYPGAVQNEVSLPAMEICSMENLLASIVNWQPHASFYFLMQCGKELQRNCMLL